MQYNTDEYLHRLPWKAFVCIFLVNVINGIETTNAFIPSVADPGYVQQLHPERVLESVRSRVGGVSQISRRLERSKRETIEKDLTISEDTIGYLFQLEHNDIGQKTAFFITDSTLDRFEVDGDGRVSLRQGESLDYEDEKSRLVSLTLERRSVSEGTVVARYDITIRVIDVNDELPYFTTKPYPYLATMSSTAASGTPVYHLEAEDTDQGADLRFHIETNPDNRFTLFNVNKSYCEIRTVGDAEFESNKEYTLGVYVEDIAAETPQKSEVVEVRILAGYRPPQFLESTYETDLVENNPSGKSLFTVTAKSFQNHILRYEQVTEDENTAELFEVTQSGLVTVKKTLDYEKDPHTLNFRVQVVEGVTGLKSDVELTVHLIDVNEYEPVFTLHMYLATIPENAKPGDKVLEVSATDGDAGTGLHYYIDNDLFRIETLDNRGHIYVRGPLDYDNTHGHMYRFTLNATDNGKPPRTGTAGVQVNLTNVNDHPPVFVGTQDIRISADALPGAFVTAIQAVDLDGGRLRYSLIEYTPFLINPDSGVLKLDRYIPRDAVFFNITVTATDNGDCCDSSVSLETEIPVLIKIVDVNNHKPTFARCNYRPMIEENREAGTIVMKVTARDKDKGINGEIQYSLIESGQSEGLGKFEIDQNSGTIRTTVTLDRESSPGPIYVTVVARDKGKVPLESFCSFPISVGDTNDNSPVFDAPSYEVYLSQVVGKNEAVITVHATDNDFGNNGTVDYRLLKNSGNYFNINQRRGTIYTNLPLSSRSYKLVVEATDGGGRSTSAAVVVNVDTDLNNQPPKWLVDRSGPLLYKVDETARPGVVIAVFETVVSGNRPLGFDIMEGRTSSQVSTPFRIESDDTTVSLVLHDPLVYTKKTSFTLRIRAAILSENELSSEISLRVEVTDKNTNIPHFVGMPMGSSYYSGSVMENTDPGKEVLTVLALDEDATSPNNKVAYSIVENGDDVFFSIDEETGQILSLTRFNREQRSKYYITVMAKDGVSSDRPDVKPGTNNFGMATVRITITDANDNAPYFDRTDYEADIKEDVPINTTVISIQASDPDTADDLRYALEYNGGHPLPFTIHPITGDVVVSTQLDHETQPDLYRMTVWVSDGLHTSSTGLTISVQDINDNAPQFSQPIYTVLGVKEEDHFITAASPIPILMVEAVDLDTLRSNNIQYQLVGQYTEGPSPLFYIDTLTREIFLTQALDRDQPYGREVYEFNVLATDEPNSDGQLIGYAVVQVKPIDINDNSPLFEMDSLQGGVMEDSKSDTFVMKIVGTDYDEGENGRVSYRVISQQPSDIVSVHPSTGEIRTIVSDLDRETTPLYKVLVEARDHGVPSRSNTIEIRIDIIDINDNSPIFDKNLYKASMSERQTEGSVLVVKAHDADMGENAKLNFSFEQESTHFGIETEGNNGKIFVTKSVDLDAMSSPEILLTVMVTDGFETHMDTAQVRITVVDYNDNAPVFDRPNHTISIFEDIEVGTELFRFEASDKDSGENGEFDFFITQISDPSRHFEVEKDGRHSIVKVRRNLDRETTDQHIIHLIAIDKGYPALTGTTTLTVNVKDINDNFPVFAEQSMYQVVVMENQKSTPSILGIHAVDLDLPAHGPPFGFGLPCDGVCPCADDETCGLFTLSFEQDGDSGRGSAVIGTKTSFDREQKHYYYLPIVTWDMRGTNSSLTGTNTVVVEIGDSNDNIHSPGFQQITVNNYKGLFGNMKIGKVHAEDADDWEYAHKIKMFTHTGPDYMKEYFQVDRDTGDVIMLRHVPEGVFKFNVDVHDQHFNVTKTSVVEVSIVMIPDAAVYNTGSFLISEMTPEEIVRRPKIGPGILDYGPSILDRFRKQMAESLELPENNVHIVSVTEHGTSTEIYITAYRSSWYASNKIEAVVYKNIEKFQAVFSGKLQTFAVNHCPSMLCKLGCFSEKVVHGTRVVINTKGTSFVSVNITNTAQCGCPAVEDRKARCNPAYCYNGGTCLQDRWRDIYCECPEGFDGPRCQSTKVSFNGTGIAQYPYLQQCENSSTSLEILTFNNDALLMYEGPIRSLEPGESPDFLLLELIGGYPSLRINLGDGELQLQITGQSEHGEKKMEKLNDGKWHRIDIVRRGKFVRLIVDHCLAGIQGDVQDRTVCESTGLVPGERLYLGVYKPLQMGGRESRSDYPQHVTTARLSGSVKNLRHNTMLYDLYVGQNFFPGVTDGCVDEDRECDGRCTENGICELVSLNPVSTRCVCKPGFRGDACQYVASVRDLFKAGSFLDWQLKDSFHSQLKSYTTDISLRFRTRDYGGVLFFLSSDDQNKFLSLEIEGGIFKVSYNLGGGPALLSLPHIRVNDGRWHSIRLQRYGSKFILAMDGGEGRLYTDTLGDDDAHYTIPLKKEAVFAGALLAHYRGRPVIDSKDLRESCLSDIFIDQEWLPLTTEENPGSLAAMLQNSPNTEPGCERDDCAGVQCYPTFVCVRLWGTYQCRCPKGMFKDREANICKPYDYCTSDQPCFGSAICVNDNGEKSGFRCICHKHWQGKLCNLRSTMPKVADFNKTTLYISIAAGAFVILIVAIAALIILKMKSMNRRKKRDNILTPVLPSSSELEMREDSSYGIDSVRNKKFDLAKLKTFADEQITLDDDLKFGSTKKCRDEKFDLAKLKMFADEQITLDDDLKFGSNKKSTSSITSSITSSKNSSITNRPTPRPRSTVSLKQPLEDTRTQENKSKKDMTETSKSDSTYVYSKGHSFLKTPPPPSEPAPTLDWKPQYPPSQDSNSDLYSQVNVKRHLKDTRTLEDKSKTYVNSNGFSFPKPPPRPSEPVPKLGSKPSYPPSPDANSDSSTPEIEISHF
ncbi:hypothetical protein ScPMuIL_007158 [Solemya velum]